MGIEPTRGRANDPSTALKAVGAAIQESTQPVVNKRLTSTDGDGPDRKYSAEHSAPAQNDPGLAAVVTAWPGLPDAIRAGLVAMVKAANKAD